MSLRPDTVNHFERLAIGNIHDSMIFHYVICDGRRCACLSVLESLRFEGCRKVELAHLDFRCTAQLF